MNVRMRSRYTYAALSVSLCHVLLQILMLCSYSMVEELWQRSKRIDVQLKQAIFLVQARESERAEKEDAEGMEVHGSLAEILEERKRERARLWARENNRATDEALEEQMLDMLHSHLGQLEAMLLNVDVRMRQELSVATRTGKDQCELAVLRGGLEGEGYGIEEANGRVSSPLDISLSPLEASVDLDGRVAGEVRGTGWLGVEPVIPDGRIVADDMMAQVGRLRSENNILKSEAAQLTHTLQSMEEEAKGRERETAVLRARVEKMEAEFVEQADALRWAELEKRRLEQSLQSSQACLEDVVCLPVFVLVPCVCMFPSLRVHNGTHMCIHTNAHRCSCGTILPWNSLVPAPTYVAVGIQKRLGRKTKGRLRRRHQMRRCVTPLPLKKRNDKRDWVRASGRELQEGKGCVLEKRNGR